ncbi:hypothetical protein K5X82_11600 [Halosquirtibacter xylanolyticus]|uniref:hypothetical protein n=1 Tax=Halosquirtibacter xylanolyticus TaxID=3374599 RepID=UPI0037493ED7|nr:hypothetical protein K5X82_11600 [Prolixibacteraceae bacterium]
METNQQCVFHNAPEGNYTLKIEAKQGKSIKSSILEKEIIVTLKAQNIDISANLASFHRLKYGLFKQCIMCHTANLASENGHLSLDPNDAYSNLVQVDAHKTKMKRVTPNDLSNSFLLKVLTKNIAWDHQYEVLEPQQIKMIETWINEGALDN